MVSTVSGLTVRAQGVACLVWGLAIGPLSHVPAGCNLTTTYFVARVVFGSMVCRGDHASVVGCLAPFGEVSISLAVGTLGVISKLIVLLNIAVLAADGYTPTEMGEGHVTLKCNQYCGLCLSLTARSRQSVCHHLRTQRASGHRALAPTGQERATLTTISRQPEVRLLPNLKTEMLR
jgi:hypothetical protein